MGPDSNSDESDASVDDEAHLRALAAGDEAGFDALFERHVDFVYNVAFRRTASWSAAEDITGTVFLELWRQRRRVATQAGSLRPWLAGVTANQVKRHWRGQGRLARALGQLAVITRTEQADHADDLASRLDDEARMATLLATVGRLPEPLRDVLTLWAWEELSYDEIAAALDIPVGTVRSRLSRARARLATNLGTPDVRRAYGVADPGGVAE